jgi:hypothetical protein
MDPYFDQDMAMNDACNKIAENRMYSCTHTHGVDEEAGGV